MLMRIGWIGLGILIASSPGYAVIYQWTDNHGRVHFSDSLHKGSKAITLSTLQCYSSQPNVLSKEKPSPITVDTTEKMTYELTIIQPENQTTIRNTEGLVSLMVSIQPSLKKGETLQVILDGSPMGIAHVSTAITLRHINRGSHVFFVQRIDSQGVIKATSHSVTFYMMPPKVTP